ncbi:NERD domain-containing protein [Halobacillus shinanisalinarum]|uniref:NERD domain-containing protein n=1 Tax=Halobacillus shinanisalinarum TaxID=2932258 RepID=A0ABY4GTY9_9BACI|nr:nuclease-related domain-containing protein [Halobacillus shinanisalinarum]UOQ91616.1 NERD domain-containing protein [Halobacillus shinanisalinarum]
MNIKHRSYPLRLKKLEALLRRLPPHHPKIPHIRDAIARTRAGYQGERSLDFHLSFIPHKDYLVIHDLRLFDGKHFFQMDTVLLSQKFILILEVKNISGTLLLDRDIHQLTRISNEKEEAFPDPVLQIERQQQQLALWIEDQFSITSFPIEALVLLSGKNTVLKLKNDRDSEKILKSEGFIHRLNKLEQRHQTAQISLDQLYPMAYKIVQGHRELHQNVLELFGIEESELLLGVYCQSCFTKMVWVKGKWQCSPCGIKSTDSHIQALQDYAYLCHPKISNKQARKYLGIKSGDTIKRLLVKLGGNKIGSNKDRKYEIPLPMR